METNEKQTEEIRRAIKTFLNSGEYGRGCYKGEAPCKTTLYFDGGHVSETEDFQLFYVLHSDFNRQYLNPSNLGF